MKEEVLVCVRVQIIEIRCDCMRDSSVNDACHMTSSSSARGWSKCLFLCVCVCASKRISYFMSCTW